MSPEPKQMISDLLNPTKPIIHKSTCPVPSFTPTTARPFHPKPTTNLHSCNAKKLTPPTSYKPRTPSQSLKCANLSTHRTKPLWISNLSNCPKANTIARLSSPLRLLQWPGTSKCQDLRSCFLWSGFSTLDSIERIGWRMWGSRVRRGIVSWSGSISTIVAMMNTRRTIPLLWILPSSRTPKLYKLTSCHICVITTVLLTFLMDLRIYIWVSSI